MTEIKVYKVIRREDEFLYSFWAGSCARVKYQPNEWAQAPDWLSEKGYHLLAFKSLDMARKLHGYMDINYEIWEAVGESEILALPPVRDPIDLGHGSLWHRDDAPLWPEGTCMFRRVKLVKRIQRQREQEGVQEWRR